MRMRKGSFLISMVGILLLGGSALLVPAGAVLQKPTAVSLGDVASVSGTEVMVPLYFTPNAQESRAGRLSASIGFETQSVRFLRAEKGIVLETSRGTFAVKEETDAGNAAQAVLRVEITAGDGEGLREGVLLFLTFTIKPEASSGTTVTLPVQKIEISSLETPARAIEPVTTKNGTIQIIRPEEVPYTSCFFFTH